jgi:hypothetical protein
MNDLEKKLDTSSTENKQIDKDNIEIFRHGCRGCNGILCIRRINRGY